MAKIECHYEILSISRDATDDEIKKSYKKLARIYHPDKNIDNIDESTNVFLLIKQAHDILIDPQERAWYDKHREATLKSGSSCCYQYGYLDVYQYFNTTCYSGFGDDEKGFYTVYREIFKQIKAEEYKEGSLQTANSTDCGTPEFGQSDSNYEEVVGPFYGYWESYCTRELYPLFDKDDKRCCANHKTKRSYAKYFKRQDDKVKKQRNEEVRALVAFIRKRDPRVQAYKKKLEQRVAEITRKTKEKKQKDRQQRLKAMEDYKEADWCAMTELEDKMKRLEAAYDAQYVCVAAGDIEENNQAENAMEDVQDEDGLHYDEPYCVACNKAFKTDKSLLNYEKSEKHKENVEQLVNSELNSKRFSEQPKQTLSKKQKKKKGRQQKFIEDNLDDEDELYYDELYCIACNKAFKTDKAFLNHEKSKKHKENFEQLVHSESNLKDFSDQPKQTLMKKQKKGRQQKFTEDNLDDEHSVKDAFVPNANSKHKNSSEVNIAAVYLGDEDISGERHELGSDETKETLTSEKDEHITNDSTSTQHSSDNKPKTKRTSNHQVCNVCKTKFPTRNKLFYHNKKTGHAFRLQEPVSDDFDVNKNNRKVENSRTTIFRQLLMY